jgi:hypothetical protein
VVDGIARRQADGAAADSLCAVRIGMIRATSVNRVTSPPESPALHLADLYLHGVQGS